MLKKELIEKGLKVIELIPELKDRSIFDDERKIGSMITEASSKDEINKLFEARGPSFEFPGRLAMFSGEIYEALGMRQRAVDIYKEALDIFLIGINYPKNIGYSRLVNQVDLMNYAIHFGINPPITYPEENLLSKTDDSELEKIYSITNYLYQTLARILYEKVKAGDKAPFDFVSRVSIEYNGLIDIGDFGVFDEYGLSPEIKEKAYHLARCKEMDIEHFNQKAQIERAALEALVKHIEK